MKEFYLRAALAALAAGCAFPQDLAGDWQGTLDAGGATAETKSTKSCS